jgi:Tfp pilus assembly protein PilN
MIEINLIPDVKQELLKAKRVRTLVISGALVVGVVSVGLVVILALYLFTVQSIRGNILNGSITSKSKELEGVDDLSKMLTVQSQLAALSQMHSTKNIDSRLFDILTAVNPAAPNQVSVSSARIDAETKTISIEAQAVNGFEAAEAFKKTILDTAIVYKDASSNENMTKKLTYNVSTSDMSYGEDSNGKKVLRFAMSFVYDEAVFARTSTEAVIAGPNTKNVTDSFLQVPQSLFSQRATSAGGDN